MNATVLSPSAAQPSRHEWDVVMDEARPERGVDPAAFLARVGPMVAALAGGRPVTSVEPLEVHGAIARGERLWVTATRDGEDGLQVVARRRRGAVVLAGALRFDAPVVAPGEPGTLALVQSDFTSRHRGDLLLSGTLASWVHASSWASAQGLVAAPVALEVLERLAVLQVPASNEGLRLKAAVSARVGRVSTVTAEVRGADGALVAQARARFRQR